jgi:hypothetical protein
MQSTASINNLTGSLITTSSNNVIAIDGLNTYTSSIKAAAIVSSSQQVQNYFTFAKTGSANTFYGTQTITGSLNVGVGTSDNTVGDLFVDTANKTVYIGRQSSTSGDNTIFAIRNRLNTNNALYVDPGGTGVVQMTGSLEVTRGVKLGTATGNVEVIGNLVMSSAGNGIDFSATSNGSGTMTSELLNDYEEGTWTPSFAGTGGQSGQVYATQEGTYTKVGRLVTFSACVALSTLGTFTGYIKLVTLPFTPASTPSFRPVVTVAYNTTITSIPASIVYAANAFMYLYSQSQTSVTSITQLEQAALQATTVWNVSGFYYTT